MIDNVFGFCPYNPKNRFYCKVEELECGMVAFRLGAGFSLDEDSDDFIRLDEALNPLLKGIEVHGCNAERIATIATVIKAMGFGVEREYSRYSPTEMFKKEIGHKNKS